MTVSRATLIRRGAERLGGHGGTLSFTAGVSTRATLAGQASLTDDDSQYVGWHLFMLDATNETDRERAVTSWNAAAGVAGWEVARADTTRDRKSTRLNSSHSQI